MAEPQTFQFSAAARLKWRLKRAQKGLWFGGILAGIMWLLILVGNGCVTKLLQRPPLVADPLPAMLVTFLVTFGIWAAIAWKLPAEGTRRPDKAKAIDARTVQRFDRHAVSE